MARYDIDWRGVALTLVGYNWEVGERGEMLRWRDGWGAERADGHYTFTFVALPFPQKMEI